MWRERAADGRAGQTWWWWWRHLRSALTVHSSVLSAPPGWHLCLSMMKYKHHLHSYIAVLTFAILLPPLRGRFYTELCHLQKSQVWVLNTNFRMWMSLVTALDFNTFEHVLSPYLYSCFTFPTKYPTFHSTKFISKGEADFSFEFLNMKENCLSWCFFKVFAVKCCWCLSDFPQNCLDSVIK